MGLYLYNGMYNIGGLNEYQGAAADMACLHICPLGQRLRELRASVCRAGRQARHAAELWR